MIHRFPTTILIALLLLSFCHTVTAQADIKVNGVKINHLDKKKRKQGNWIFFDKDAQAVMSCTYTNDVCTSPYIFYESGDTAFVRFPLKDGVESFLVYRNGTTIFGSFVYVSGENPDIEIDPAYLHDSVVIAKVKTYRDFKLSPSYLFGQQRVYDYASSALFGSTYTFNKSIYIVLTINTSGIVTDVEFPKNKNTLSGNEERELYKMYSTMPRWQPLFYQNRVSPSKVAIGNNLTIENF